MPERTLLQWLKKYKIEIPPREIKRALGELNSKYPGIEYFPEYERAETLWEFLRPEEKFDPHHEDFQNTMFLPANVRGYIRGSNLSDLVGTGWGNCYTLSIIYTILARELGLDCWLYFVDTKEHAVCYVTTDGKKILVDTAVQIFDKYPEEDFKQQNSHFEYEKNSFLVEDEYVAIIARAWSIEVKEPKRDVKEMLSLYIKYLKKYPRDDLIWLNKGDAYWHLGKYRKAIECYDIAIAINPLAKEAWSNKGAVLCKIGKEKEGMECLEKAIKIDQQYVFAWANKGNALCDRGEYEEALKCYDNAIKFSPKSPGVWNGRGYILVKLGRKEEAVKCYENAIEFGMRWNKYGTVASATKRLEELKKSVKGQKGLVERLKLR